MGYGGAKAVVADSLFDFIERPSAKDFSFHSQSYPLFSSEPKTLSIELVLEDRVFSNQIVDNGLLMAAKPAGQSDDQKLQRR